MYKRRYYAKRICKLKKDICRRCWTENTPREIIPDRIENRDKWLESQFDLIWKDEKWVYHGTACVSLFAPEPQTEVPPSNCKYILEHMTQ